MASKAAEDKVTFLLYIMSTFDFKPNYDQVARDMGINTANNAQRQFKAIVEAGRAFKLVSSKEHVRVVANNDGSGVKCTPTKKPKATPQKRKRADDDGTNGEAKKFAEENNEVGSIDNGSDEDEI